MPNDRENANKTEAQPAAPDEKIREDLVQSYAVAKRLLPFLAKRGIPATPKNYRIFYDYLIYSNPDLNKIVNELLDGDAKFTTQLSENIYNHFYLPESIQEHSAAISKAASDFMALSTSMEQNLETAITHASHYQEVLANTSRQMAQTNDKDRLQPMLDELMSETEAALASNGTFSHQITEASQIIANLKAELINQTTLAKIDELTKLFNRRHLNIEAPRLIAECQTIGRPLSIAIFDLDHFKRVNDTWGHNFGDKVLIICSDIIKKTARSTDMAVRLGGEEFLLVLPGLDLAGAMKVAERVRNNIINTDITIRGESLMVTISGGVAEHRDGENINDTIGRGDSALYLAKNEGRNQIRLTAEDAAKLARNSAGKEVISL